MQDLQKMRVAMIMMLSQENSKLLSRRQKVSGKEIEVMTAERDVAADTESDERAEILERLYAEDRIARAAMAETEDEIRKMERMLAKIDADIAALCQA
ncbi:MAG: hypothetical protein H5U18_11930 [Rhodobacteraceae bacterium]|nr:hypothetical protein [Paracoccaceae bacterium]